MIENHSDNPVIHRSDRESNIDPKLAELHSLATWTINLIGRPGKFLHYK